MNLTVRHIAIILILACFSCSEKEELVIPSDIIPMNEMSKIIADMTLVQAVKNLNLSKEMKSDNPYAGFYVRIYENHEVSEADFKKSFDFYQSHEELMTEIYKSTTLQLKMLEDETQKKEEPSSQKRDDRVKRDSSRYKKGRKPVPTPRQ